MRKAFLILMLASLSFASTHSGDGTYKLFEGDSVRSDNGFDITLSGLHEGFDSSQQPIVDKADFDIGHGGDGVASPSLEEGESYTAGISDGKRNVTVKVLSMGYELDANQQPHPYARAKISSSTFVPETLKITTLAVSPGETEVSAYWETNLPANGTIDLYGTSFLTPVKSAGSREKTTAHSLSLSGLKSNTEYTLSIVSCDLDCVSEERVFRTGAAIPVISSVKAVDITNDSARIIWKTDIDSDSKVYYRKAGATEWQQVPPAGKYDDVTIHKYYDIPPVTDTSIEHTAAKGSASLSPALSTIGDSVISGGIADRISGTLLTLVVKKNHSMNLFSLQPKTAYEYFVSSCADLCANSSSYYFNTTKTLYDPYAELFPSTTFLDHGSSLTLTISAMSMNTGGKITDALLEWDDEGVTKTLAPKFGGDAKSFIPDSFGSNSIVSITFADPGTHTVTLSVKDSFGKGRTVSKDITVGGKTACKATSAKYYPPDTTCSDKWPNDGGATIDYNQEFGACHAVEVCDESLDYMVADAESCCNGEYAFSDYPGEADYGYDKSRACDIAINTTRMKKPMSHLSPEQSMKACKTAYLVYGIGSQAIYMKDYFKAEACCKDNGACGDNPRFVASPWPRSNVRFSELRCYYTLVKPLFGDNYKVPKDGWYTSDTDPKGNNIAMVTVPTHSSVGVLNTGTCVDYGLTVTTALRKTGYKKNEIFAMEAPGHVYNLVWLPGDSKYSFIDTVGNRGGEFFTGGGWGWKKDGADVNHCSYKPDRCVNDLGFWYCPAKGEVSGC